MKKFKFQIQKNMACKKQTKIMKKNFKINDNMPTQLFSFQFSHLAGQLAFISHWFYFIFLDWVYAWKA